ncbi:hypothetical protein DTW89_16940 [Acidovorax sp. BoFeN1]|uniref:Wadjet anti-phage system protein JetD domain-containing protein n=1 Tax=Acidovorax sp. BoFeN1 TaxID=1231053 RepID=UPI000E095665|nr:Wadjet anti-phage system protein JetD domain-containing protein [Acidovorax sp. BoFeN1]RDD91639.1 hypothetical protein DTW89_16940 [Acidovorax sp. BoFeN1]
MVDDDDKSAGRGAALARKALERLLARAENAAAKGPSHTDRTARSVTLPLSEKSFPEYLRLQRHADKAVCNASLQLAERDGAISVEWDHRAGERAHVQRIVLNDGARLARHLGIEPRWDVVALAERQFEPHTAMHPVLAQVIEAWRKGNLLRGTRPGDVASWLDAIHVIQYCASKCGDDIAIRRLSASLFRDSKRIEAIWPALDALVQGDAAMVQSEMEDLFSELGLVKFPPTLLVAGSVAVSYGDEPIMASRPYVGFAPSVIRSVSVDPGSSRRLLTVENLTTFHELAGQRPDDAIVIYTGGMPSPSWKRAYAVFLKALAPTAALHHWGDIDVGGFRIASHIAKCCEQEGRSLRLHGMRANAVLPGTVTRRELVPSARREILRICERWEWSEEAAALGALAVEQEAMEPCWPE